MVLFDVGMKEIYYVLQIAYAFKMVIAVFG